MAVTGDPLCLLVTMLNKQITVHLQTITEALGMCFFTANSDSES